jgi:N-acyl-L-homoserine lactone synthetase
MKNVFAIVVLCACLVGCNGSGSGSSGGDIDKIIAAKAVVRSMVNYPDTLSTTSVITMTFILMLRILAQVEIQCRKEKHSSMMV